MRNVTEGSQSLLDFAMHHFAPSILFNVPGMSFRSKENHRRVQREFLAAEGGSFSADQQVRFTCAYFDISLKEVNASPAERNLLSQRYSVERFNGSGSRGHAVHRASRRSRN